MSAQISAFVFVCGQLAFIDARLVIETNCEGYCLRIFPHGGGFAIAEIQARRVVEAMEKLAACFERGEIKATLADYVHAYHERVRAEADRVFDETLLSALPRPKGDR